MSMYHGVPTSNDAVLPMYTFSSPSPYSSSSSDSPIDGDLPRDDDTIKGDDLDQLFGGDTILVDGSTHLSDEWPSLPHHEQVEHKISSLSRGSGYTSTGNYESTTSTTTSNITTPNNPNSSATVPTSSSMSVSTHSATSSSTPTTATTQIQGGGGHMMSIVLLHKPRGSKGVWHPIAQGDHIRVTKGKGKRLKLEVRSSADLAQDIAVFLVLDGVQVSAASDSGLVVESIRSLPPTTSTTASSVTELSLKLSRLSRRISILVRAKTRDSPPFLMEARSIEFSAHNNGKEMCVPLIFGESLRPYRVHNSGGIPPSSPQSGTLPPPTTPPTHRSRSPKDSKFLSSPDSTYSRSASPPSNPSPVLSASPKNPHTMVPIKYEQMPGAYYHQPQLQQQQLHQQTMSHGLHPGQYYPQNNLVMDHILPVHEYPERVPSESESERKRKRLVTTQDSNSGNLHPNKTTTKSSASGRVHSSFNGNAVLVPSNSPNHLQPHDAEYNDLETTDTGANYSVAYGDLNVAPLPLSDPNSPQNFVEQHQQHHQQQQQLHHQLQQQLQQQIQLQHQLQQHQSQLQTLQQSQLPPLQSQPQQPQQPQQQQPQQIVQGGLDVKGFVRAQGFIQYSDSRLKTDIKELTDALGVVSSLEGKSYKWKQDQAVCANKGSKRVIGLIAQEVQKILPEVVHEVDGYLSVAYAEIVPVLIEALKQHLANDAADKAEIQQKISDLDRRLLAVTSEQDQWKSCYQTMVAMRFAPLWVPPPFNHLPPVPAPAFSLPQIPAAPKAALLNGTPVMSYQQQYIPTYIQQTSSLETDKTHLLHKQKLLHHQSQSQIPQQSALRHWCSVLGFLVGMCMAIIGIVLLLKPSQSDTGSSSPNSHLELSVVLLGLGVVCMVSVSIFYFCSTQKPHKNFAYHVVNV